MIVAALFALAIGAMSLRTKGVYFIMVTLAFAQMAFYVVHDTPVGGGGLISGIAIAATALSVACAPPYAAVQAPSVSGVPAMANWATCNRQIGRAHV